MNLRVRPSVNFLPKLNHTPTRLITPYLELSSFHHALDLNNFRAEARGGGTLGISGWGCAAGSMEPLTFTRASSAEFCYPIHTYIAHIWQPPPPPPGRRRSKLNSRHGQNLINKTGN